MIRVIALPSGQWLACPLQIFTASPGPSDCIVLSLLTIIAKSRAVAIPAHRMMTVSAIVRRKFKKASQNYTRVLPIVVDGRHSLNDHPDDVPVGAITCAIKTNSPRLHFRDDDHRSMDREPKGLAQRPNG